jgi:SAM-dependent methyltransferase
LGELLGPVAPSDHARQTLADAYISQATGRVEGRPWRVLDLGCGTGGSVDAFRARDPDVQWVGLDLPDSPEARSRTRTDAAFHTFDGLEIPFGRDAFDLVYCKQVLEHVRRPESLLNEVRRVLAPGGFFAGSTSQLEPFHSYSFWGYTPVGFCELLRGADLAPLEIRPGIDAFLLLARRALGQRGPLERRWQRWWAGESPVNRAIDRYGRLRGLDNRATVANKLLFCGQFAFLARRPA